MLNKKTFEVTNESELTGRPSGTDSDCLSDYGSFIYMKWLFVKALGALKFPDNYTVLIGSVLEDVWKTCSNWDEVAGRPSVEEDESSNNSHQPNGGGPRRNKGEAAQNSPSDSDPHENSIYPTSLKEAKKWGITILAASKKYEVPHNLLWRWSKEGRIPILFQGKGRGSATYLDKARCEQVAEIHREAKRQGKQPVRLA